MTTTVNKSVSDLSEILQVVEALLCSVELQQCNLRKIFVISIQVARSLDIFASERQTSLPLLKCRQLRKPEINKTIYVARHVRSDKYCEIMWDKAFRLIGWRRRLKRSFLGHIEKLMEVAFQCFDVKLDPITDIH